VQGGRLDAGGPVGEEVIEHRHPDDEARAHLLLDQCVGRVRDDRVVQMDRRGNKIRDAAGVREKFGVTPELIPDFLALVGDAADGYPGIPGIGSVTAAQLLNRHGAIENFPPTVLGNQRERALLFKDLATLRTDAPLFKDVNQLRWRGLSAAFAPFAERMKSPRLLERALKGQVDTLFKGETLRGLLLNAYAFGKIATIAGIAAIVSFIGAGIMLLLAGLGLWHSRRVDADVEVLSRLGAKIPAPVEI